MTRVVHKREPHDVDIGRRQNADPRWVLPLLCRRGKIGKQDIGKIQVLARETRVGADAELVIHSGPG